MFDTFLAAVTAIATSIGTGFILWSNYTKILESISVEGVTYHKGERNCCIRVKLTSKKKVHIHPIGITDHKVTRTWDGEMADSIKTCSTIGGKEDLAIDIYCTPMPHGESPVEIWLDVGLLVNSKHELYPSDFGIRNSRSSWQ